MIRRKPLAYYSHTKKVPQNLLIIENKDTFLYHEAPFDQRRRSDFWAGDGNSLSMAPGCSAHSGIFLCMEPYITNSGNKIYYFGDLDYEGISIYEDLCGRFGVGNG